ncbi:MAG: hypothetical protein CFE24_00980 [Flavobacterium sp. BFFFF2]|nr:MAG: hypothetical protein CFE24_00980 [Flavobacterium sp. BFFFF2]
MDFRKANFSSQIKKHLFRSSFSLRKHLIETSSKAQWASDLILRGGSPMDFRKANFSSQIKKHLFQSSFSSPNKPET